MRASPIGLWLTRLYSPMYRIIFTLILLIVLYFLIRSAIREFRGRTPLDRLPENRDQMVQDPMCHVFVPRGSAVREVIGGQAYCFCSQGCAAAFQKQMTG
jgi:YHS domain-containing protein